MSNVKTLTRAQAIALAIEVLEHAKSEDWDTAPIAEAQDVLKKMHAQLVKPRAKAVSKARKGNEALAAKVRDAISVKGDGMSTKEIVNLGIPEITTTQKASAVCRVAVELGYLHRCVNGKAITYALV